MRAHRRVATLIVGVLMLTACESRLVQGSTTPPDGFPSIDRTLFGCPDLNGVYAWPGTMDDGARPPAAGGGQRELTLGPFELPNVSDAAAISFDNSFGNAYFLVIARQGFTGDDGQRLWSNSGSRELGMGEYRCGFGWLEFRPASATTRDGASLRLARGDDGSLIVGAHAVDRDAQIQYEYPALHTADGPARARVDLWRWHHLPRLGLRVDRDGRLTDEARER